MSEIRLQDFVDAFDDRARATLVRSAAAEFNRVIGIASDCGLRVVIEVHDATIMGRETRPLVQVDIARRL
jgi:hypothetical protein